MPVTNKWGYGTSLGAAMVRDLENDLDMYSWKTWLLNTRNFTWIWLLWDLFYTRQDSLYAWVDLTLKYLPRRTRDLFGWDKSNLQTWTSSQTWVRTNSTWVLNPQRLDFENLCIKTWDSAMSAERADTDLEVKLFKSCAFSLKALRSELDWRRLETWVMPRAKKNFEHDLTPKTWPGTRSKKLLYVLSWRFCSLI